MYSVKTMIAALGVQGELEKRPRRDRAHYQRRWWRLQSSTLQMVRSPAPDAATVVVIFLAGACVLAQAVWHLSERKSGTEKCI
jgi:hypothetical protein